jgi:hypothetical protein
VLVDSPEKAFPLATYADVCLINAPRAGPISLISTDPLLKFWSVALHPPEDRARVNFDTTLPHHLSQVAMADPIFAVPADAQQDDRHGKATALENRQQNGSLTNRFELQGTS